MSQANQPRFLRNSTNFCHVSNSHREGMNTINGKADDSPNDTEDYTPVFGNTEKRKQEHLKKKQENENGSFFNAAKNASPNDDKSNNNFEIYEKEKTRDSFMNKINNEIKNIKNRKIDDINSQKEINSKCNNVQNMICNNQSNYINTENDNKEIKFLCDSSCKCENCHQKKPENDFQHFKTVSFKNHDQVDILVEHDKKQACCLIYNNNCFII